MKTMKFNTGLFLILFFLSVNVYAFEGEKNINKQFAASEKTKLVISNKFGNVDIVNWKKDQVAFEIKIKVTSGDEEAVKEALEKINISIDKSGNTIKAETEVADNINRGGSFMGITFGDKVDFEINYSVHTPDYISLSLSNKYGDAFISRIKGHTRLDIKYGNFKANELLFDDPDNMNEIILGYGDGEIKKAGWLKLDIKYSDIEIDQASSVTGDTKYSKIAVNRVDSYLLESKYDKHRIGELENMVIEADYSDIKIKKLSGKLDLVIKYTDCKVDIVTKAFKTININNKYGIITLGLDEEVNTHIKGKATYCKIDYPKAWSDVTKKKEVNETRVNGTLGSGSSPSSQINIETKYGDVNILKLTDYIYIPTYNPALYD